jgi:hypothetical protein
MSSCQEGIKGKKMDYDYYSSYAKIRQPRRVYPEIIIRIKRLKWKCDVSPNVSSFLSSIAASHEKYGGITEKQYKAFCDIEQDYLTALPPGDEDWNENYDATKRETAEICAKYYKEIPPYFGDLSYKVLNSEDFIPTEKQFKSLTQNKYSMKVLQSHFASPRFKVNDYVSLRKKNPYDISSNSNIFIILQVAPEPVTSAARASKKYKILTIDDTDTHIVEERFLKSAMRHILKLNRLT